MGMQNTGNYDFCKTTPVSFFRGTYDKSVNSKVVRFWEWKNLLFVVVASSNFDHCSHDKFITYYADESARGRVICLM